MSTQLGFFMPGREKSGKIQILCRIGSSGRQMTKIQLTLRNMQNILPHTGWFNSQDKYSALNDSVRGSKGAFRPHCASMAHRPRAPARIDRRRTFGKSDFVQMTFSGASKKHRFFVRKIVVFILFGSYVLRVFCACVRVCPACACFLCACLCVSCVCVFSACVSLCVTPVCPFKTSASEHSKSPRVCQHRAYMCFTVCTWCRYTRGRFERAHGCVLNGHTESRGGSFSG